MCPTCSCVSARTMPSDTVNGVLWQQRAHAPSHTVQASELYCPPPSSSVSAVSPLCLKQTTYNVGRRTHQNAPPLLASRAARSKDTLQHDLYHRRSFPWARDQMAMEIKNQRGWRGSIDTVLCCTYLFLEDRALAQRLQWRHEHLPIARQEHQWSAQLLIPGASNANSTASI